MRYLKFFPFFIFMTIFFLSNVYAEKIYKHVPFHVLINQADILIVNYDFSEKDGIRCSSNNNKILANFSYKGHRKSAHLPLILQSSHVPQTKNEELADIKGQFSLLVNKKQNKIKDDEVTCNYAEVKSFQ